MRYLNLFLILSLVVFISFMSCTSMPEKHYFYCNQQSPTIVDSYIPKVLFDMGYIATKDTAQSHSFIANKQINVINTKKGVVTEYIQIRIKCMFDTAKSEITQYYVKEINNNVKTKTLDKEQIVKFAPDVKLFQEKMLFYCNPEFKGR